jgi:hypothetical protein
LHNRLWGGWDFVVDDATHQRVGAVKTHVISIGGVEHIVYGCGWWPGGFTVSGEENCLVARKDWSLGEYPMDFRIEDRSKRYTLRVRSRWGTSVLADSEKELGTIAWEESMSRIRVELPDDMPLILRVFLVWLVIFYSYKFGPFD